MPKDWWIDVCAGAGFAMIGHALGWPAFSVPVVFLVLGIAVAVGHALWVEQKR